MIANLRYHALGFVPLDWLVPWAICFEAWVRPYVRACRLFMVVKVQWQRPYSVCYCATVVEGYGNSYKTNDRHACSGSQGIFV